MAQTFLLNSYVSNITTDDVLSDDNIELIRKSLYEKSVKSKDYPEDNLVIIYNEYTNKNKNPLNLECRSVIVDRRNFKMVSYSCPTPIYNRDAMSYLLRNKATDYEIFECYEGSLLSVFYFEGKWYFSSRRNISSSDDNPHFQMFLDVLSQDGYESFDDFTKKLDNRYSYHFVLIHHKNMNVVNYEKQFGENYRKLCFIFARDYTSQMEINAEDLNLTIVSENIFLPKRLQSIEYFDNMNKDEDMTNRPYSEGVVIKHNNNLLKLQNMAYQFYKAIGTEKNLYRGFIHLYQINKLKGYFSCNDNTKKYEKIVNPTNNNESFDTVGTIDALFNVCTTELFELFNKLYDENGNHIKNGLYELLPSEYKTMIFNVRKLYFINKKKGNELQKKNIYYYLKNLDSKLFESFVKQRKLMMNWARIDKQKLSVFNETLFKCNKISYKLSAIYTSKLFPEIMPDDIPHME